MGERLDQLVEHRAKRRVVAAHGGDEGVDVSGRVSAFPRDSVPGLVPELGDERSLGATVPFAERMGGVDLSEVMRQAIDNPISVKSAEVLLGGELRERVSEKRFDVLWQGEEVGLGNRDRANLAGPRIDVPEDVAMERAKVLDVVAPGQRV